jgi:predicted methyltransferase
LADGLRIVREVAAAVGLAEGELGVSAVIAALVRLEPVSIRRISRAVELPVPIVASVCGELRKRAVVAEQRPARLTPVGRELFSAGALTMDTGTCATCHGRGVVVPRGMRRVAMGLSRSARNAPPPQLELDQCHCTVDTKLRRVLAMHEADALAGRRILLLGDDDLTSLAIRDVVSAFGSRASIAQLTVLDLDPAVIAFVEQELAGARFPVSCRQYDAREPLPAEVRRAFDTVVTDPPYTLAAATLFLSRAADALAGPGGNVFLSFGSRRPDVPAQLQRAIGELGLVIRSLVRDFNEYVGAGAIGGTSHLYQLLATSATKPLVSGTFAGPLYTADTRDERFGFTAKAR